VWASESFNITRFDAYDFDLQGHAAATPDFRRRRTPSLGNAYQVQISQVCSFFPSYTKK